MTARDTFNDELKAREFGKLLQRAAAEMAPSSWQDYGMSRLVRSVSVLRHSSRPRPTWSAMALAAASVALVAGGLWLTVGRSATSAVNFKVVGADLGNRNYVVAPADAPTRMKFSDGSSVELEPTSRLRVQQLTPHGATVVLERGRSVTSVEHHEGSNWKVLAGPFEISVVGTRFQTDWDPATETLSVDLYEGTLKIEGQRLGESATLQKGQRFRAIGHNTSWSISPIESGSDTVVSAPSATDEAQPQADLSEGEPGGAAALVASPKPSRPGLTEWASAMARGEFDRVVSEAEARGIASCLEQCSTVDVRILADAARYTRRFGLAEQALQALRRRSPAEAPSAAYLLGALNESQGRSMAALRWYEHCVAEAPAGRVVSEAQAGRLRMLVATNQIDAAKSAAQLYLKEHPRGVGEPTARKILGIN